MVYVTRGLVEALLAFARDAEPEDVSVNLAITTASEFEETLELHEDTPIFTHFYLPDAGKSISAVFGVDLATPPGRTQGKFVSHSQGPLEITQTDNLREIVLVAIPPWEPSSLAAFDRSGNRQPLEILDTEPPTETI